MESLTAEQILLLLPRIIRLGVNLVNHQIAAKNMTPEEALETAETNFAALVTEAQALKDRS